jgi:hypothetical protein
LNTFAQSTGLRVNDHKSNIYPINVDIDNMKILANTFGCQIGCFPFTYLGLPMELTKPKVEDLLSLIQRIERRIISTSHFLTLARRVEIVNFDLSTLPTFYIRKIKLPLTMIKLIDKVQETLYVERCDVPSLSKDD